MTKTSSSASYRHLTAPISLQLFRRSQHDAPYTPYNKSRLPGRTALPAHRVLLERPFYGSEVASSRKAVPAQYQSLRERLNLRTVIVALLDLRFRYYDSHLILTTSPQPEETLRLQPLRQHVQGRKKCQERYKGLLHGRGQGSQWYELPGPPRGNALTEIATSNDPWGPVGSDMAEIAQITFNK